MPNNFSKVKTSTGQGDKLLFEKENFTRGMPLSLSVRVAEAYHNKKRSSMTIAELIKLAEQYGYKALCLRASQVGIHSTAKEIRKMGDMVRKAELRVSMITGDFAVPLNDQNGPEGLRNIKPYLDLAEAFNAKLIRICMMKTEDVVWAQRACDEARERGIRLAHQSHCASLFETVEGSLEVLRAVGRENFGMIYEPANWMISGEGYGPDAIERIKDYIFNVYVQNHRLNPDGDTEVRTWRKGPVGVDNIGLWKNGGVDFTAVFSTLHRIKYSGFVTVHQAFENVMSISEAVRRSSHYLSELTRLPI